MAKIIFGLVGPIASGKDTVKKYLEKKYKAENCRFSTILRDVLNRIEAPVDRKNLVELSFILRKSFGEDVLAKVIAHDVQKMKSDIVVADGVRRLADIEYLKKLPNFALVAIDAKPEIRYERLVKRNENIGDDKKTYQQFLDDHKLETEVAIPDLMNQSEYKINNDGSLDELYKQIDEIILKLSA